MHTALAQAPRPAVFPHASRTLVHADQRTRALADAMVRLNAEGGATDLALLSEGFSEAELRHHGDAARALANRRFVRQVEPRPEPSDDELIDTALDRVGGLIDAGLIVSRLRGDTVFTPDRIARIWPRLCTRLATTIAKLPVPGSSV